MFRYLKNAYGEFNDVLKIGPVTWPYFDLIFIHDGEVEIKMMGKEDILLETSQSVLIYPDTPFRGYSTVPVTKVSVHHFDYDIELSDLPSVLKLLIGKKQGFEIYSQKSIPQIEQDIERMMKFVHNNPLPILQDIRSSLMVMILAQLKTINSKNYPNLFGQTKFHSLISWLQENLDQNISLDQMAEKMNLSTSHFRAMFRAELGTGPGNYYFSMRIHEATRLLRETSLPIKEIAGRIGYNEISHFYRAFRKFNNSTPNDYRQEYTPLG